MPFAYVLDPAARINVRGGNLVITAGSGQETLIRLVHLETLVVRDAVRITHQAVRLLLRRRIPVRYVSRFMDYRGALQGPAPPQVRLRFQQYRLCCCLAARLDASRHLIGRKLAAATDLLNRHLSNYADSDVRAGRDQIAALAARLAQQQTVEQVRGIEGQAAAVWWRLFARLNRSEFSFPGRNRRPPRDPVNALLSLASTLLVNELAAWIESAGLDPHLGFFHQVANGRPALATDLMEPFRHSIADRMVLRALNLKQLRADDFRVDPATGGCRLEPDSLRRFLGEWEAFLCTGEEPPRAALQQCVTDHCDTVRAAARDYQLAAGMLPEGAEDEPAEAVAVRDRLRHPR